MSPIQPLPASLYVLATSTLIDVKTRAKALREEADRLDVDLVYEGSLLSVKYGKPIGCRPRDGR